MEQAFGGNYGVEGARGEGLDGLGILVVNMEFKEHVVQVRMVTNRMMMIKLVENTYSQKVNIVEIRLL